MLKAPEIIQENKELITKKTMSIKKKTNINMSNNISNHPLHKISKNLQEYNNDIINAKNTKKIIQNENNSQPAVQNFNEDFTNARSQQNPLTPHVTKKLPNNFYQQATEELLNLINPEKIESQEAKKILDTNEIAKQYHWQNQYNDSLLSNNNINEKKYNINEPIPLQNNLYGVSLINSVNKNTLMLKQLLKSTKILGKK